MQHDDMANYKICEIYKIGHIDIGFRVWVHTCGEEIFGQCRCRRDVEEVVDVVEVDKVVVHVRSRSSGSRHRGSGCCHSDLRGRWRT